MKISIIDSSYPLSKMQYGVSASYLFWELSRHGITPIAIEESDFIFVTMQDPRQWPYIKTLRAKYPYKKIIVGGSASSAPYAIGLYCDCVVVGDGQAFIKTLIESGYDTAAALPNIWIHGETRPVTVDQGFPWNLPPIMGDNGHVNIFISRGCRKKCYFCQTGWAYDYQETESLNQVLSQVQSCKRNKITYVSNDLGQYSGINYLDSNGDGSYSVEYILKKKMLPKARVVRLGVEGVSERIREIINKPIKNNDLYNLTLALNRAGKSVKFFMMAGFHFETAEDWEELKAFIARYRRKEQKGTLEISFSAWIPSPATPMCILPLKDDYWKRFEAFREWFFNAGWSNKIKLLNLAQPETRLQSAMAHMGLTEKELREGGKWGPNDRIEYPFKKAVHKIGEKLWTA
ncbi:MAG: hypothetical protein WC261_11965 [Synergistaceae bacterium]|jgi:radical SAM superfamily enzyme YgiQ (UPF0313 family)